MIAPALHYSVYNLQFDDSSYITLVFTIYSLMIAPTLHYCVYNLQFDDSSYITLQCLQFTVWW